MKPNQFVQSFVWIAAFSLTFFVQAQNDNVQLLGRIAPVGENGYTDVWGYAANDREYAIVGHVDGTLIIEVTNPSAPRTVALIDGPSSNWRDLKTHAHYAYVTNETGKGLQIIDLQNLPDSAASAGFYAETFQTAHNLFIESGYAYIAGSNTASGLHILDLRDPINPVEVATWELAYWHDVVVKNDTAYGSAIYRGQIEVVDATDKNNLFQISATPYPNGFTHNIWMTSDNEYIAQTDERNDLPVNFWDFSDHLAPELIATYNAGPNSIAHNAHIQGDYVYISYYYDGLKILDISRRSFPVEVGNYDTFPDDSLKRGNAFSGAWGAYPFLPSGNILVSDRKYGLHVLRFDNTRAGYLAGEIVDASTQQAVEGVAIDILDRLASEGETTGRRNANGRFIIGAKPGQHDVGFKKFGYEDFVLEDFSFEAGVEKDLRVLMTPLPVGVQPILVTSSSGDNLANVRFIVTAEGFRQEIVTNQAGRSSIMLPYGRYQISLVDWGYLPATADFEIASEVNEQLVFETGPGYVETFEEPQPWALRMPNDQSLFDWQITRMDEQPYGPRLPDIDFNGDPGGFAVISRARIGSSTLTSPRFDALVLDDPYLEFARFYNPYNWANAQANDTLIVAISNDDGATWKQIDFFTAIDLEWELVNYRISDFVNPTADMRLRFVNVEGFDRDIRASSFCALDEIKIISKSTLTNVTNSSETPARILLFQNYPNPFNGATVIRWQQSQAGLAEIVVSDLLGRELMRQRATNAAAGTHSMQLTLSGYASGVYFYRIALGELESSTRKLILLR